jgi:phage terminase small subunit
MIDEADTEAIAYWNEVGATLPDGTLDEPAVAHEFANLAFHQSRLRRLMAETRNMEVVPKARGAGMEPNPKMKIIKDLQAMVLALSDRFGLSPLANRKLKKATRAAEVESDAEPLNLS